LLTDTAPLFLRRYWASLLCLALAAAIGLAGIADHTNKQSRMEKAEVLEWYCAHDGTHCGGPSSDGIEAHWNERELGYQIALGGLCGFAILLFVGRKLRRWRDRAAQDGEQARPVL
jgi:hypothetical protein